MADLRTRLRWGLERNLRETREFATEFWVHLRGLVEHAFWLVAMVVQLAITLLIVLPVFAVPFVFLYATGWQLNQEYGFEPETMIGAVILALLFVFGVHVALSPIRRKRRRRKQERLARERLENRKAVDSWRSQYKYPTPGAREKSN